MNERGKDDGEQRGGEEEAKYKYGAGGGLD